MGRGAAEQCDLLVQFDFELLVAYDNLEFTHTLGSVFFIFLIYYLLDCLWCSQISANEPVFCTEVSPTCVAKVRLVLAWPHKWGYTCSEGSECSCCVGLASLLILFLFKQKYYPFFPWLAWLWAWVSPTCVAMIQLSLATQVGLGSSRKMQVNVLL